jgi:hypothetical protein
MATKRAPNGASQADIFMLAMRVFLLGVIRGFAVGKNTHEEYLDEALQTLVKYGIAPIHLVNVSNAVVALLHVANAEYDAIEKQDECPN